MSKPVKLCFLLLVGVSSLSPNGEDGKNFINVRHGRFDKKVCFISGGTSGLGEFTAYQLAQEGCAVIITGRRELKGAQVVKNIEKLSKSTLEPKALYIKNDVTDYPAMASVVAKISSTYGRLDSAFINAGQFFGVVPLDELPLQEFRNLMDINLLGSYNAYREVVPLMKQTIKSEKSREGSIVFTTSVLGLRSAALCGVYVISKHAIEAMKNTAAAELAPFHIRVNTVAPTITLTELIEPLLVTESWRGLIDEYVVGSTIRPANETTAAVTYMLSEDAVGLSGNSLHIDTGNVHTMWASKRWTKGILGTFAELAEMSKKSEL